MTRFAPDGKSFLYALASRSEVTFYRQAWSDGKTIGKPQIALKLPFVFSLNYQRQRLRLLARSFLRRLYPPQLARRPLLPQPSAIGPERAKTRWFRHAESDPPCVPRIRNLA